MAKKKKQDKTAEDYFYTFIEFIVTIISLLVPFHFFLTPVTKTNKTKENFFQKLKEFIIENTIFLF